jgi:hypothetical protein
MNLYAKSAFASAMRRLELASVNLETAAVDDMPEMASHAYAEVVLARGEIAAALQHLELEELVAEARERTKLRLIIGGGTGR